MNFNYRDFFIHNDDLHIIKEQLSILDEMGVSIEDALAPNAKAVWDMYDKGGVLDEQKIADKLGINVDTVKKIIDICEKKFLENKTIKQIADELKMTKWTVNDILTKALASDFERDKNLYFVSDAVEIYELHKNGSKPDDIVNSINISKIKKNHKKINVDEVNLVLKIVNIAKEQIQKDGVVNAMKIHRQIGDVMDFSLSTLRTLLTKLNLGKPRYTHRFTEEQDAFVLFNYLQGIGPRNSSKLFNDKFSTKSKKLNISDGTIYSRLKDNILEPKGKGKNEISEPVLKLLTKYFPTVNIEKLDAETEEMLTKYISPQTVGGRDPLARKGGKVDPTRQMSGQTGNLEPDIHQTINTGESPASGQLGKKSGAPINPQGALSL